MEQTENKKHPFRGRLIIILLAFLAGTAVYYAVKLSDRSKYMGHGFKYMNGYSSTDFTGYHVYDAQNLYKLDHEASLRIEKEEDMPVLDGAEACYPVYSAMALAVYKNIGRIENDYHALAKQTFEAGKKVNDPQLWDVYLHNGKYVTFTNSSDAYHRLIRREADMVFAARPSEGQKQEASRMRETILTTPIGREAFVFFTEKDNPVDNLTSDQIRSIFSKEITNWKEVGGKNQKIIAFQRPENSGSQVCMRWFMGDVPLAEPDTFETVSSMGGTVEHVKQYHSEAGAISYSFRYFLEELRQEGDVKILSVDGVYPDLESIRDGSYPLTVSLVCATLASNEDPYVRAMMHFILSDDGQEIIENTGYAPLADRNVEPTAENTFSGEGVDYVSEDGSSVLTLYEPDQEGDIVFELKTNDQMIKGYFYDWSKTETSDYTHSAESFDWKEMLHFEYDPEGNSYRFTGTELNEKNLVLPAEGTVFKAAEQNEE